MKNFCKAILLSIGDFMVFCIVVGFIFKLNPILGNGIMDEICTIISFVLSFVIFYGFYNMVEINLIKDCRFNKVNKNIILKAIILGICFSVISEIISNFSVNILHLNNTGYNEVQQFYSDIQTSWFGFVSIVIIGPILEEIFYRGIMLRQCLRYVNPIWAIIIQAFFFGFGHGNLVQFMYTFIGGIFIGYLAYYTKSIIPCITMHIVINLISILFDSNIKSIIALSYFPIIALILIGVVGYVTYNLKSNSKASLNNCSE